jgi:sec-independent protein translocase protein TatA
MNIGAPEIILIIFIVILLFGSKKLPELARALGKSLNEFKRGQTESAPEKKIEKQAEPAEPDEKKKP